MAVPIGRHVPVMPIVTTPQPAEPAELSIELPEADERRCHQYGQAKLALLLAEVAIFLVVLSGLTLSHAAAALLAWCHPPGTPGWLGDLYFLVLVGCLIRATLFPVAFLSEFYVDRRFGMSWQPVQGWFGEWLCRATVFGWATVIVLLPVAETLRWWPLLALPWGLAFLFLRPLFIDYVYYPLMSRFYPVAFLRNETFMLPGIGKITLPVYQMTVSHKTRRANAAIRLRGKKSAIYVTDTLIDEFTDGEERVVMAHEFGHLYDHLHLEARTRAGVAQAHRKLVLGSAQLLAGFLSLLIMQASYRLLGLRGVQDLAGFPLLAALTIGLAHLLSPLLCAEARHDERDADEYALAVTGDVAGYVSVMRKLRSMNLEESDSSPLCRLLFDTHPTYGERLKLALEYRRRLRRPRKSRAWRGWKQIQRHGRR
jgi:STE24 endopeptidase